MIFVVRKPLFSLPLGCSSVLFSCLIRHLRPKLNRQNRAEYCCSSLRLSALLYYTPRLSAILLTHSAFSLISTNYPFFSPLATVHMDRKLVSQHKNLLVSIATSVSRLYNKQALTMDQHSLRKFVKALCSSSGAKKTSMTTQGNVSSLRYDMASTEQDIIPSVILNRQSNATIIARPTICCFLSSLQGRMKENTGCWKKSQI